jgi:Protein of unknown function (DUF3421)
MPTDYDWHRSNDLSRVPDGAVLAGQDLDGDEVFVARIQHENNIITASFTPNKRLLAAFYNQQPVESQSFEVISTKSKVLSLALHVIFISVSHRIWLRLVGQFHWRAFTRKCSTGWNDHGRHLLVHWANVD